MNDKFQQIETALAHHDRQIEELSEMIMRQWQEIDQLKRHIVKTVEKLELYMSEAKDDAGLTPAEIAARDKPPHY